MISRKVIEEYAAINYGMLFTGLFVIIINYIVIWQGIQFFHFEYLTERLRFRSSQLYLYAKLAVLISTAIMLLSYNSRKAMETKSNQMSLVLIGLFFLLTLLGLVAYLISSAWLCTAIRLGVECFAFVTMCVGMHLFLRLVNGLGESDNFSELLTAKGGKIESPYYIETVTPKKAIIPLVDMNMTTFICAGGGGGKTATFLYPILAQNIENGEEALFCYDAKFPECTNVICAELDKKGLADQLKIIDFENPQCRVNPLHPNYIKNDLVITEIMETLARNLGISSSGDRIWFDNFVNTLSATTIALKYLYPQYCTLPHIIALMASGDLNTLISLIETVPQARIKILSLKNANGYKIDGAVAVKQSEKLLSSLMVTIYTALSKLDNPNIFYVLSGNDFDLKINEKSKKQYVVLGSRTELQRALRPALALIGSTIKNVNNVQQKEGEERIPLLMAMDEFNTMYIPDVHELANTGRSRLIQLLILTQSRSLMELPQNYGLKETAAILGSCANEFYGNSGDKETIKSATEMIGNRELSKVTKSRGNSRNTGGQSESENRSTSTQDKLLVKAHEIRTFKKGEFIGKISGTEKIFYRFRGKFKEYDSLAFKDKFEGVKTKETDIFLNYLQVFAEAKKLLNINKNRFDKSAENSTLEVENRAEKKEFNFLN